MNEAINEYDDGCSELSQTTDMSLTRNQLMVLSINYFRKSSIADA